MINEHDVVKLQDGRTGTIQCVLDNGEAFVLEVEDESHTLIKVVKEDLKEIIWSMS